MSLADQEHFRLSDRDLEFLIKTVSPGATDIYGLKRILREDEVLRNAYTQNERVFKRVMDDDQIFLTISPTLFFEILLRKAVNDLKQASYTIEKTSNMTIPVFDSEDLIRLLAHDALLIYLADMLSSFTKVQNYTLIFKLRGIWRKIHL